MTARVQVLDAGRPGMAEALVALQRAAYAVEAALIAHDGIPQLTETPGELVDAGLTWLGVLDDDGLPVAAVAFSRHPGAVGELLDVERLVVHPGRFRQGLGRALVSALPPAPVTVVATGRDNLPALALYASLGFTPVAEQEVAPGLWIRRLVRRT